MKPLQTNKSFVDDKKVSDHHAIIPTEQYVQLEHMTSEERKIYDLVVRRFLSVLYPPFIYEQTTLKGKVGKEVFVAKGKTVQQIGWKAVYEYEEEQEEDLADSLYRKWIKEKDLRSKEQRLRKERRSRLQDLRRQRFWRLWKKAV